MGVTTTVGGRRPGPDGSGDATPAPEASGAVPHPGAADLAVEVDDAAYARIATVLKAARGLDLDAYKPRWIRRRIALRVRARACGDAGQYAALIEREPGEIDRLNQALTITVTQFFRNASTYARIVELVLPPLFERAGSSGLRVFSVGCASGEEPYSIAMLVRERFADRLARTPVTIVGIDRDAAALERARVGVYDRDRLVECPDEIRDRYFARMPNGRFQLAADVRRMVTLTQANVFEASEMPHGPADLILCRNVLIYFARAEQERLLADFEQRLAPGGFLVLGKAETLVASDRRRFKTVCPWERIYRRP
jgi:chemotaxis protein methyltransferase CheR